MEKKLVNPTLVIKNRMKKIVHGRNFILLAYKCTLIYYIFCVCVEIEHHISRRVREKYKNESNKKKQKDTISLFIETFHMQWMMLNIQFHFSIR